MRRLLVAMVAAAITCTGCSGGGVAQTGPTAPSSPPTTRAPLPAGSTPSSISKQVCSSEARRDIASALGETAKVSTPTWVDHLYACTFSYPTGSFGVSVKELSSWAETTDYYDSLQKSMGRSRVLGALGQGAFQTTDGSVVVRKDWKVLLVDSAGLPPQFGVPPTSSGAVAVTVADIILGCWAGD